MYRSPLRSHQNFPESKIGRFDKSDTDTLDLIIECFNQIKVVRNNTVISNNIVQCFSCKKCCQKLRYEQL